MHAGTHPYPGNSGLIGQGMRAHLPFIAHLWHIFWPGGKRIVFNKNCLEIATTTILFKAFQAGLDGEFQIARYAVKLRLIFDV